MIKIGNGVDTEFCRDPWCDSIALRDKFQELFDVCNEHIDSVAAMAARGWRLTFRRWLDERAQTQLRQLRDILFTCALSMDKDKPLWSWEKNRVFSVKSMYAHLCSSDRKSKQEDLESQDPIEDKDLHVASTTEYHANQRKLNKTKLAGR